MSIGDAETSIYGSQPNELYTFTRGGNSWLYTSSDEDKIFNLQTYSAIPIKRANLEQNQQMSRSNLTLTMDKNAKVLDQFRASPPSDIVIVSLLRYSEGDTDSATMWMGRIVSVKFSERTSEVRCEPVFTSMRRPTLRRMYQHTCPFVLYGNLCRAASSDFSANAIVIAVAGNTITAAAFATHVDGYYAGGYIEWDTGNGLERRFITDHVGQIATVSVPFNNLTPSKNLKIYAGCDRTMTTCDVKFNNLDNFGGQPFYPATNPMAGNPIF